MTRPLTLFVVGGYGSFGGRLIELLKAEASLTILVAGRSLSRAQEFCDRLADGRAQRRAVAFDRDGDIDAQLARFDIDVLIDASGPFQMYGGDAHRLIEACIARRIHYLDLADDAAFVRGVVRFDARARAQDVIALSGVSTCPTLTASVVRRLASGMTRVESIEAGIAPSPFAELGRSVIRAIASYAGKPIRVWRGGELATARGLLEQRRVTIAPPGCAPLESRVFSMVEVPDSEVLPMLWPELQSVWVGAGTAPVVLHRSLIMLARLHRLKLLPSLLTFASFIHAVRRHLRWGEHRGGMFVSVVGADTSERRVTRTWHLIAEGEAGPFIPVLAAEHVIRRMLRGERIEPGARSAATDIRLEDYEARFAIHRITTGIREHATSGVGVYARVLGSRWAELPAEIRALHAVGATSTASGVAHVTRGENLIARIAARCFGLPPTARDVPLRVRFAADAHRERWIREFGDHRFHSVHTAGCGRDTGYVLERFGPFTFVLALVWDGERLHYLVRRWRFLGMPLPRVLAPISQTTERVYEGKFHFDVRLSLPLAGLLVHYRGWLVPQDLAASTV